MTEVKLRRPGISHVPALLQHHHRDGGVLFPPYTLFYGGSNQGSERLHHLLKATQLSEDWMLSSLAPQGDTQLETATMASTDPRLTSAVALAAYLKVTVNTISQAVLKTALLSSATSWPAYPNIHPSCSLRPLAAAPLWCHRRRPLYHSNKSLLLPGTTGWPGPQR